MFRTPAIIPFRSTVFLVCLALLTLASLPSARADDATLPQTFPIALRLGHIWIDGTLNGKTARFILDTGAGTLLVTPEAARRCGVVEEKQTVAVSGAAQTAARRIRAGSVGIGGALLRGQGGVVLALPEQLAGCDGLLGFPFFAPFAITIDYARSRCTIGRSAPDAASALPPETSAGDSAAGGVWLPLTFDRSDPEIDGALDGAPVRLRIDTGDGSAAMLYAPYVEKQGLRDRYTPRIQTVTGRGIGGLVYGDIVRVPTLTLGTKASGTVVLRRVLVELSRQTGGGFFSDRESGQIGAEVLKRFTVTFDYPHRRVHLTPNASLNAPFVGNRAGMSVDEQQGRFVVVAIVPGSPAAQAGFQDGDEVVAVDGVAARQVSAVDLREKFRQAVGTRIRFRTRREGRELPQSEIVLRDLL